jgi:hypothetical protein
MPDPSLPVSPAEGRTRLTEQWRQAVYPHVEAETFARYLADETAKGWDDVRVEVAALHAIVAAALVLRPSEDWQPIETAPKGYDGTRFNYVLFWGVSAGRSFDHPVVVIGYMDHDRTPVQFYRYKLHITHWRPLPPAPGTEDR